MNALIRRGTKVCATPGINIWYHSPDAPAREDYSPLTDRRTQGAVEEEED